MSATQKVAFLALYGAFAKPTVSACDDSMNQCGDYVNKSRILSTALCESLVNMNSCL